MASFTALNGVRPFHTSTSRVTSRGTRIYWAATALYQDTPDGRYEIEKLSSHHWSVTHHQIIDGNDTVVRYVGWATTKTVAIRYAEIDHDQLAERVEEKLAERKVSA